MLFQQLIQNNLNYEQESFSLQRFVNKAIAILPNNNLIMEAQTQLQQMDANLNISRPQLVQLWANVNIPFYVKIIITFWWGGLSDQHQAPKFYTEKNFQKLHVLNALFKEEFDDVNNDLENFQENLKNLYNKFKFGDFKLFGIDTPFFTKLLQFGISNPIQPIIFDHWSSNAIFAELLDGNLETQLIFRNPKFDERNIAEVKLRGSAKTEFNKYWYILTFFNNRCHELEINPLRMEEIMFGWGRDYDNPENPRVIANNIIRNHLGI